MPFELGQRVRCNLAGMQVEPLCGRESAAADGSPLVVSEVEPQAKSRRQAGSVALYTEQTCFPR